MGIQFVKPVYKLFLNKNQYNARSARLSTTLIHGSSFLKTWRFLIQQCCNRVSLRIMIQVIMGLLQQQLLLMSRLMDRLSSLHQVHPPQVLNHLNRLENTQLSANKILEQLFAIFTKRKSRHFVNKIRTYYALTVFFNLIRNIGKKRS